MIAKPEYIEGLEALENLERGTAEFEKFDKAMQKILSVSKDELKK